ncbi:MAG TPA: Crp/Fnr family transcriptional regulator [Mycobacterium sp.]|nr:Crp/Fnr family transcriptional regulator [Mycobacterium sp.]
MYQALLASGIFGKTDPARLSRWREQLTVVRFPPGHVVGARGDVGGRLYVVVSGKMKLSNRRPGGGEIALAVLGRFEIFGAVSLFDPGPCVTRVIALTEAAVVPIERSQLLIWMAECSELSAQMLRLYARRTKEMTETLTDFAFADVHSRVASRLLWLKKRFGRRDGEVVRIVHDLILGGLFAPRRWYTGDDRHNFARVRGPRLDPFGRQVRCGRQLPRPRVGGLGRRRRVTKIAVLKWF